MSRKGNKINDVVSDIVESKSKDRITKYGEVFTNYKNICSMLDLVAQETLRLESKFLEQACGEGGFLQEIIRRKFNILRSRYKNSKNEFDKNLIILISSIYGIDILEDNVRLCKENLFNLTNNLYRELFKEMSSNLSKNIQYILSTNILLGDSLKMKDINGDLLRFSEWAPLDNIYTQRRDFYYEDLINLDNKHSFIPKEIKTYEPIKFLDIGICYDK